MIWTNSAPQILPLRVRRAAEDGVEHVFVGAGVVGDGHGRSAFGVAPVFPMNHESLSVGLVFDGGLDLGVQGTDRVFGFYEENLRSVPKQKDVAAKPR